MPSTPPLPSQADDYTARDGHKLDLAFWNAALNSVGARLRAAEAVRATFEDLIAEGTDDALAVINANVSPQLSALNSAIAAAQTTVAALEDQIALLTGGGGGSISPLLITQDATHRFITDTQLTDFASRVTASQLSAAVGAVAPALIAGAPTSLNTLDKLAAAIGDDPSFAGTIASALAQKLNTENLAAEASVASAATVNLGAQGPRVLITGTAAITSFGTGANKFRLLRFAGALTLTHNATTLILPGGANVSTQAGDTAIVISDGSNNWRVIDYQRANGTALVAPSTAGFATTASVNEFVLALRQVDAGFGATYAGAFDGNTRNYFAPNGSFVRGMQDYEDVNGTQQIRGFFAYYIQYYRPNYGWITIG